MNAKYIVALILALQVSTSLCEIQAPSQELLDKYNNMKATFRSRMEGLLGRTQVAIAPYMERADQSEHAARFKEFMENLQTRPEFQQLVQAATHMGHEAAPLVDKLRTAVLGFYEQNLRAHVGGTIDQAITNIKPILDTYLPAE